jgi:type VI secretion system protein ImpF
MNHNAMTFDIEGDLWAQPLPLRLYLRTELDLETGSMDIIDRGG